MITIREFISEAKAILDKPLPLEQQQAGIGAVLSELSRRDDLTRFGLPFGPSDATTLNYMLWREPPYLGLLIGAFEPGYSSPVHEHGDFWVVSCGYRGRDRWDMYERLDDGSRPGYSEVKLVDQIPVPAGTWAAMPRPPRAIHSHNNEAPGQTLELFFSVNKPLSPSERLVYDVEAHTHWPSGYNLGSIYIGDRFPPPPAYGLSRISTRVKSVLRSGVTALQRHRPTFCPMCMGYV